MPRALIAGCGYLGRAIADLLAHDGWELECWTMSPQSAEELSRAGYSARSVDISNHQEVAARGSDFDCVFHTASTRGGGADSYRRVYFAGADNLMANFSGARFLFVGSTSVYPQKSGEWVSEESRAEPDHETGKILRESENIVLERGGVVVRLAGLYGPGRSALLQKFLSGDARIDPDRDRFMNQIHRDDAAAAVRFLMNRSDAMGQLYNVADNQPTLLSECYQWMAANLGRPVPPAGTSIARRKRGDSNKRVSNAKLRGLGWAARYPTFADGMQQSVLPNALGRRL